ncbi:hypothetical protein [Hansschlegelia plantiphila]|uniref:Haemolysin-type calcium binding-related domain-containing protein n=1 Tax=Hansschlegelia plantiphila TaxID=374655 RepID=A0A9W6J227_9HYPH|nr:hypothetical protein [Hansschlegelia plantiphila]GLK69272.1 hypothetical protein GCM10008179_29100 [Hansschlegelia plantiphila]
MPGGGQIDLIDGGRGEDVVSYAYTEAGVTVNLPTGKGSGGSAEDDVYKDVASAGRRTRSADGSTLTRTDLPPRPWRTRD